MYVSKYVSKYESNVLLFRQFLGYTYLYKITHTHTRNLSTGQSAVSDHPFLLLIRSQARLQYNVMVPDLKIRIVMWFDA